MNETLQLIDQLVAEHKLMLQNTQSVEKRVNDASLILDLKKARDSFVPGQSNQTESLKRLDEALKATDTFLTQHFAREETALMPAVKKMGDEKITYALETLLFEHTDLRDRMYHSKKRITELQSGSLSPNIWEATAKDIQVYINHTTKLLATHAANENRYFNELRKFIKKSEK
jgi:hemerythrin-like domain-containing protein